MFSHTHTHTHTRARARARAHTKIERTVASDIVVHYRGPIFILSVFVEPPAEF